MLFEKILTWVALLSLAICTIDYLFFRKNRKVFKKKEPKIIELAYSLMPVLMLVLIIRSFIVEPFRIPSGSMKPTLLEGDLIVVNKFAYGIKLPISSKKIIPLQNPKVGDVVVFRNTKSGIYVIKRLVGLPGDKIEYKDERLYINGVQVAQTLLQQPVIDLSPMLEFKENLAGVEHRIYRAPGNYTPPRPYKFVNNITVPKGCYFVMGDNRNNSEDSRFWGFVHEDELMGRAVFIWLSIDTEDSDFFIRFNRIGKKIV